MKLSAMGIKFAFLGSSIIFVHTGRWKRPALNQACLASIVQASSSRLLSALLHMIGRTYQVMGLESGVSCRLHPGVHLDRFSMSLSHLVIINAGAFPVIEAHGIFYLH